jgi:choline kinase
MQAILLAAGESSRMYPLSSGIHKSMLEVLGKPLLEHTLEKLNVKPEEAIFIDDMERNTKASEALGIKSIVFENFDQFKKDLEEILK